MAHPAQNNPDYSPFIGTERKDELFRQALRHSGKVRFVKIALPIAALIIGFVFCWFTFFAGRNVAELSVVEPDGESLGTLVMNDPQLEGYTDDNQPYYMRALRAIQDPKREGLIMLEDISAQMPAGVRGQADIAAVSGIYDSVNGRLLFDNEFTVTTQSGLEAYFKSADINLATSYMVSNAPVDIRTLSEHLTANRMEMREGGKVLSFDGQIRLVIIPTLTQDN